MSLIRTLLSGLSFLLMLALVFWLVYSNNTPATLKLAGLWQGNGIPNPFDKTGSAIILPMGLWYITFTFIGIFIGLFLGWFIGGKTRTQARQGIQRAARAELTLENFRKEADQVKSEVDSLKEKNQKLETQAKRAKKSSKSNLLENNVGSTKIDSTYTRNTRAS